MTRRQKAIDDVVEQFNRAFANSHSKILITARRWQPRVDEQPSPTFWDESSPAHGLQVGEFDDLPMEKKRKLIRLMARMNEKSFRRGGQQGVEFKTRCPKEIVPDLVEWRYGQSLDNAIGLNGWTGLNNSTIRLFVECGFLDDLGFHEVWKEVTRYDPMWGNEITEKNCSPTEPSPQKGSRKRKHDDC